jgi:predicted Zn-dependent protease with MMP-like domain
MEPERFEELVGQALDEIPEELGTLIQNVVVLVEEQPPEGMPANLLGLYRGVPMTERDGTMPAGLPDMIFVFRGPLLAMCTTQEQVVREVRITVLHEVAHYFGIDDARLHDLGYG